MNDNVLEATSISVFLFPDYRAKNLSPGNKMTFPGNAISWVPGKKLGAPGKKYMFLEEKFSCSKEVCCCVYEVLACPKLSSKVLTKLTQNTKNKNFPSPLMSGKNVYRATPPLVMRPKKKTF